MSEKCEDRCYYATGETCTCTKCKGMLHGVGLEGKMEISKDLLKDLFAEDNKEEEQPSR